jgi:aminoglycoside N3'-acetyltransferase
MLTKNQITKNLRKIKIKENFIIIHSDITGIIFKKFSLSELWKIIYKSFGKNKTYIFPTFTFKHKLGIWSYSKSKSESGILSEYFRKHIAIKRTVHPIHSVAIFGKDYNKIPDHNSLSSFGEGSTWEWLCNSEDVCNIALGLELEGGATICHFPEENKKVNYRELKDLKIKIFGKNNKIVKKKFQYFVRKKKIENNWKKCENDLTKKGLIKKYLFTENNYPVIKMNTYKVTNFIFNKLKKNKNYLIK